VGVQPQPRDEIILQGGVAPLHGFCTRIEGQDEATRRRIADALGSKADAVVSLPRICRGERGRAARDEIGWAFGRPPEIFLTRQATGRLQSGVGDHRTVGSGGRSQVSTAEGVGFEPTKSFPLPVFKTGAIGH
jgi:hypothetical protein